MSVTTGEGWRRWKTFREAVRSWIEKADSRKCAKILAFWDLMESEQWIVADGTGAGIHDHHPDFFFFFLNTPKSRYQSLRGNCCLLDGGIQCLIQRPQKACISIKILMWRNERLWNWEKAEKKKTAAKSVFSFLHRKISCQQFDSKICSNAQARYIVVERVLGR